MKKVIMLSLVGFLSFACTKDNKEDLLAGQQPLGQIDSCSTDNMSYKDDIRNILTQNCATSGCHAGPNGNGGLDLNTYTSAQRIAVDGELVGRIENTNGPLMPPGGKLSACDIDKIKAWIAAGAPNN